MSRIVVARLRRLEKDERVAILRPNATRSLTGRSGTTVKLRIKAPGVDQIISKSSVFAADADALAIIQL